MTAIATQGIVILLLTLLAATALAVVRMRDLWAAVMLTGIYSFLGAGWMMILDAPDVAFTEAAVGAGISTILMLGTLGLTSRVAKLREKTAVLPVIVVFATGAALILGTVDMPYFGDPRSPVHAHLAHEFLNDEVLRSDRTVGEVGVPNIVTAVLASYRGYDTMGETVVIFTAGTAVLLLLRRGPGK